MGRYKKDDKQSMILVALSGQNLRFLNSGDDAINGIFCDGEGVIFCILEKNRQILAQCVWFTEGSYIAGAAEPGALFIFGNGFEILEKNNILFDIFL